MHALIQDIAMRLSLPPSRVEEAVSLILVRVRADLETTGEAKIDGLGTFRSDEGSVTFEPAQGFAAEINKEFAAMRPIALTATGESVDVDDERALPGVGLRSHQDDAPVAEEDQAVAVSESDQAETVEDEFVPAFEEEEAEISTTDDVIESVDASHEAPVEDFETVEEEPVSGETGSGLPEAEEAPPGDGPQAGPLESEVAEPETIAAPFDEGDDDFKFETPPPPFPSKVRVPPSERRSRHRRRSEQPSEDEFPDMESVVSTRPVEPIHSAAARRRRSKWPTFAVAAAVVLAVGAWLLFGTRGSEEEAMGDEIVQAAPAADGDQGAPAESVAEEDLSAAGDSNDSAGVSLAASSPTPSPGAAVPATVAATEPEPEGQPAQQPETPGAGPVEAPPTPSETPSGPLYSWIVASYPGRFEAESRSDELRQAGFDANVFEATVNGEPAFRVGIGEFGSQADAWRNHGLVPPEATDAWVVRVK